jgi:hypothetical protein
MFSEGTLLDEYPEDVHFITLVRNKLINNSSIDNLLLSRQTERTHRIISVDPELQRSVENFFCYVSCHNGSASVCNAMHLSTPRLLLLVGVLHSGR